MNLLIISSAEGQQYDMYVCPPSTMTLQQAIVFVDFAIKQCKTTRPDEYTFEDLAEPLRAAGFIWPLTDYCTETW